MAGLLDLISNLSTGGVTRNRAGAVVDSSDMIPGAMTGLGNILQGAARGSLASALGLPGDINQAIVNNVGSLFPNAPAAPTTAQWEQLLPGQPTSGEGQIFQKIGEFMPVTPGMVGKAAQATKDLPLGLSIVSESHPEWDKMMGDAAKMMEAAGKTPEEIHKVTGTYKNHAGDWEQAHTSTWHGSPHSFTAFDASKIGSGEGAQAYGHGLYVAENPEVAKGYQKDLSDFEIKVGGKDYDPNSVAHRAAWYVNKSGNKEKAMEDMKTSIMNLRSRNAEWAKTAADDTQKELDYLLSGKKLPKYEENSKGNLYKVQIQDEHINKMLDWDKPLSEKEMNSLYESLDKVDPTFARDMQNSWYRMNDSTGKGIDGQDVYMAAMNHLKKAPSVSQMLKEAGIPGIKYLDQGSRGAGQGSRNFVIFPGNEHILKIKDVNGNPI